MDVSGIDLNRNTDRWSRMLKKWEYTGALCLISAFYACITTIQDSTCKDHVMHLRINPSESINKIQGGKVLET